MELATEVLRYVALSQLLFLALVLWRHGAGSLASRWTAAFTLSLVCYLLCPVLHRIEPYRVLFSPVFAGCFGVAFFFWVTSACLFDDAFRLRLHHWLALVALESVSFFFYFVKVQAKDGGAVTGVVRTIGQIFPQVFSLGFIILAMIQIQLGKQADLVEGRRRFRTLFIPGVGTYIVVVLAVELVLKDKTPPALIELLNLMVILAMAYLSSYLLLRLRTEIFPDFANLTPVTKVAQIDGAVVDRLISLMESGAYRQEGLTLRTLAGRLDEQEYKLRRTINQGLGFRNFNEFLNSYRVAEACVILRDTARADVPIIRISMDLGYGSLAPFNRAFRQKTGMTPTEYRRSAAPDQGLPPAHEPRD